MSLYAAGTAESIISAGTVILELKENSHIEYCKVNDENEIAIAGSDELIAIDDLDFSLIEW